MSNKVVGKRGPKRATGQVTDIDELLEIWIGRHEGLSWRQLERRHGLIRGHNGMCGRNVFLRAAKIFGN